MRASIARLHDCSSARAALLYRLSGRVLLEPG